MYVGLVHCGFVIFHRNYYKIILEHVIYIYIASGRRKFYFIVISYQGLYCSKVTISSCLKMGYKYLYVTPPLPHKKYELFLDAGI